MSDEQKIVVEVKTPQETENSGSADAAISEAAAVTVAAAEAAAALARTEAAAAEIEAASKIEKFKLEDDARWIALQSTIQTLGERLEALSAQVQSLTSAAIQTEETMAEVKEAVEAEEILTPPSDTTKTEAQENGEEESPAEALAEQVKKPLVFRL